jgi:hypothetical protein
VIDSRESVIQLNSTFSSVFALSIGNNLLGGYPIWVLVVLAVCSVGCYFSKKMVAIDKEIEV